ncbi:MAG: hypothetical protein AAB036_08725 [Elusimicrobiota bacterium]
MKRWAALATAFLACGCATGGYSRMRHPAVHNGPPVSRDQAQRWWRGAAVTLKREVNFGRSPEWEGVWFSQIEVPRHNQKPFEAPNTDFRIQFHLTDNAASRRLLRSGRLPAGTTAAGLDWRVARQARQWGAEDFPVLDLRLGDGSNLSIVIACEHWRTLFSGANDCSVEGVLRRAEPYLRAHFFDFSATRGSPPARSIAAGSQPEEPSPSLAILAVSAKPPEISPGSSVELLINYTLQGAAGNTTALESRRVSFGDAIIADLPSELSRPSGTFTSSQKLQVPASARPGVYRLNATVKALGLSAEGSALFEVKP